MDAYQQLISFLDANNASYRIIDHAPEGRTDVVSGMRGNVLAAAAKCIVAMVKISKKEKVFALAVVPGDAKVDLNAIKAKFNGEYVSFASQDIAEKLTGCVAGTILPFSFNPDLKAFIDPRLLEHDEIFFNAARLDRSLAVNGADFKRVFGGETLAIAKYESAGAPATAAPVVVTNADAPAGNAPGDSSAVRMYGKDKNIPEPLYKKRHSLAHVMAQAVLEFFPDARPTIGPPIENGFYYDFGVPKGFTPDDLTKIEARMREIVRKGVAFERREVSEAEARQLFAGNVFKLELIDGLAKGADDMGESTGGGQAPAAISVYTQDGFTDLCRGPHVVNTREIDPDAFKLSTSSSAYWRGNEKNPVLQRIYGLAFDTPQQLADYVHMQEEARKRDHRKLGSELEIFVFDDEVGPGLPLWQPNGAVMIEQIEALAKKMEQDGGYDRVKTPHLTKENLFLRSGHLPYYAEGMFPPMELDDGIKYYLKPMNCPFHHKIYAAKPRSYRDLPIRYAEYGTCYRFEQSGELFGLMRVRSMQMNDAHIYVTEEQFEDEFMAVIKMYLRYFDILGVDKYMMRLSLHSAEGLGKKYVNNPELWVKTEEMVRRAMINGGVPFFERENEAAFYGPKIDVQIFSAIGREFSLATNQVDFAVPPRFNLTYVDKDGQEKTPLCLHRAPLSTHERLIGFLIEHFAGAFPLWLAPVQAQLIPIADRHIDYCNRVAAELAAVGMRVKVDAGADRMQKKILNAQAMKIPYMLVVGDKEADAGSVAVRLRSGEDLKAMTVEAFKARALTLISGYSRAL
jgi:threonyl-tRNA synthetase